MTYLSRVDVAAVTVHIRVVGEQGAVGNAGHIGNLLAIVSALDDVGGGAILAGDTQAERLFPGSGKCMNLQTF